MRIVRAPRTSHFTVLSNDLIEDSRLTFKARGLLAYLLSRPDGWQTDADRIARAGPDGRTAILSALKELENAGYLKRTRSQDEKGRWSTACEVFDTPTDIRFSDVGSTDLGSPNVGSPNVGVPEVGFPDAKAKTETKDGNLNPLTPNAGALGEPCAKHRHLGRPGRRCRDCGTAGREPVQTPTPPPLAELAAAVRCDHGEIVGRCPLCRKRGTP